VAYTGLGISVDCDAENDIRVRKGGYRSSSVKYRADVPNGLLVLGVSVADINGFVWGGLASGRILGKDSFEGCDMLRLVPLIPGGREYWARVAKSGRFVVDEIESDKYIAVVLGDRGVCGVGRVDLNSQNRLNLAIELRMDK